jgi:hypothetical protein
MKIIVKKVRDEQFVLYVSAGDGVEELKAKLEAVEGTLVPGLRLIWEGKLIEDGNTLQSYGIGTGATLHIVAPQTTIVSRL